MPHYMHACALLRFSVQLNSGHFVAHLHISAAHARWCYPGYSTHLMCSCTLSLLPLLLLAAANLLCCQQQSSGTRASWRLGLASGTVCCGWASR